MKLYSYFIKFICLFYPIEIRRKERERLLILPEAVKKDWKTKKNLARFSSDRVKEKSVLIVEPNPYHFELQPGYCKYFQDLGYNVDVIAQPELEEDSAYIKYPHRPNIYYLSPKHQKKALQSSKIKQYDFVFLSTSVIWANPMRDSYLNFLGFEPNGKYGFFLVEHNVIPYVKDYGHQKYVDQNRSFTLGGQQNIPMLNPHYFGEYTTTSKSKFPTFVVVINEQQNKKILFDTCRILLKKNISNFKVIVAGRTVISEIPEDLKGIISFTGKTKFADLWKIYNESDFFIPMLNPEIAHHQRYREGTVTGSWQIILGFLKPAIIHSHFANYYQFDSDNSIIFNSNEDLANAVKNAISMTSETYTFLQKNLKLLSEKIRHDSLKNLRSRTIDREQNF